MVDDNQEKRPQRERRRFYRIEYPTADRPIFHVDGGTFSVINVSEGGVHILCEGRVGLAAGEKVRGRIDFLGRDEAEVAGIICRTSDTTVTVDLSEIPVPFRIILSEQRYLIRKYDLLR
ncbi:PilZ domain-containing protein [Myxococcota bacterium]|nr:PilZ domain-containing protein [Myxococcota bacterium]